MKLFYSLVILYFFSFGCSNSCDLEKANVFKEVTKSDVSNLEGINLLILKNLDTLIKANENNESDSIKGRKDKFHSITSGDFNIRLPKEDLIEYSELIKPYNNTKRKFYIYGIDFRPSDSTFDYELKLEICDNNNQAIDITHHLLYQSNNHNYISYKNNNIVKEKKVDKHWTYYLENKENDPAIF